MKRKIICLFLLCLSCLPHTACTITDPGNTPPPDTVSTTAKETVSADTAPEKCYVVEFDENESFSGEAERRASERIDEAIRSAVRLLATVDTEPIPILDCDYDARPRERDLLKYPLSVEIYDTVLARVKAFEDYSYRAQDYPGIDLFNVFVSALDALRIDHTEIFLCSDAKIDGIEFRSVYFMPGDWLDAPCDDRAAIRAEADFCDAVVDRILEKMPKGLSNYEKCFYFALVLAFGVEYNYAEDYPLYDYQAYGALAEGIAVCSGYAQAFYRLCREAGISCRYCRGTTPTGRHAWNMLDTEAGPIYVDVTWYDTDALSAHYREGKEEYLFMTQEDFAYHGYVQESCQ